MEEILNLEPHAGHCESNFGGTEIHVSDCGDAVYHRENYGDGPTEWVEAPIEYSYVDNDGEPFEDDDSQPYFVKEEGGWMYFLSEFMPYDR
jgi:hypothetical protein